jgi:predicted transcriptional regulator
VLAALSEASVTTIVVAMLGLLGVAVTAVAATAAAYFTRSTNREVKYRNGGGVDGTLAERLDARFERIETRFDRLEEKHVHLDERVDDLVERVDRNVGRIEVTERNVKDMRRRAIAFFDRFVLKEHDEERHRLEKRGRRFDDEENAR